MTCKQFFTRGKQKKKRNKKEKPRKCHIKDSAESMDLGGNREESSFYKDGI